MGGLDYSLIFESAWNMLTSWYGLALDSKIIARQVLEYSTYMREVEVEVYLLRFKLVAHPNFQNFKLCEFIRADTVGDLEAVLRKEFEVEKRMQSVVFGINL